MKVAVTLSMVEDDFSRLQGRKPGVKGQSGMKENDAFHLPPEDIVDGQHYGNGEQADTFSFGGNHSYALAQQSRTSLYTEPTGIEAFQDVVLISASSARHTAVVTEGSGDVYVWGEGKGGQLGTGRYRRRPIPVRLSIPATIVVQVACGDSHTLCLDDMGHVLAWGFNGLGQCGMEHRDAIATPTRIPSLKFNRATWISAGHSFSACVLGHTGQAFTWGANGAGQCGHASREDVLIPRRIMALVSVRIRRIACGKSFAIFISDEGEVWSCGANSCGQLGLGDHLGRILPDKISYLRNRHIDSVACGYQHALFASDSGDLWTVGSNTHGQLGLGNCQDYALPQLVQDGLASRRVRGIAAGSYHSLIWTEGGHVFSCGWDGQGQLGRVLSHQHNDKDHKTFQVIHSLDDKSRDIVSLAGGLVSSIISTVVPDIEDDYASL